MASGGPGDATSSARAWWKARATENLDVKALALLTLLAVGCALGGWIYRPSSAAPPQIPNAPQLTIDFPKPLHLQGLNITSHLMQTEGSQAKLIINAVGFLRPKQATVGWSMEVLGFTGRFCTPRLYIRQERIRTRPYGDHSYLVQGTSLIPAAASGGAFLVIHLCWSSGAPLTVGNSYFSAALPFIFVPDQAGTLISFLELSGASLPSYSPSGGAPPTAVFATSWAWSTALDGIFESQADSRIPAVGSNASVIQKQNDKAFISGILFGIAGGAALSVIAAVPVVNDRRKSRRNAPEQASDSGAAEQRPGSGAPSHASS